MVYTLFKFQNTHNYYPGLGKLNVLRTCNFRMEIEFRIRYMTKHSHSMKERSTSTSWLVLKQDVKSMESGPHPVFHLGILPFLHNNNNNFSVSVPLEWLFSIPSCLLNSVPDWGPNVFLPPYITPSGRDGGRLWRTTIFCPRSALLTL